MCSGPPIDGSKATLHGPFSVATAAVSDAGRAGACDLPVTGKTTNALPCAGSCTVTAARLPSRVGAGNDQTSPVTGSHSSADAAAVRNVQAAETASAVVLLMK